MAAQMQATPYERITVVRRDGNQVADNWAKYGDWIMSTMAHDLEPCSSVDIMSRLRGDNFLCLEAQIDGESAGIALCSISYLCDGRSLEVKALAGESFDLWIDRMWTALRILAASQGLRRVYLKGRMGWKKKLNRLGFKAKAITMEFDLNG